MKKISYSCIACILLFLQAAFSYAQEKVDNTIRDGGEYVIYNTYYGRALGGNAENTSPTLSVYGTNAGTANYVFVAEASTLHSGYYWLRHKATGKYLQASNATNDTWSVWFAGNLNKEYNSYEWGLTEGTEGEIISNRGEVINASGNYRLGVDPGKEANTYINIYYDKPKTERTVWQILDARFPLEVSRLSLYTDELDAVIAQGEAVFNNPIFGTEDEKAELATALYNARSARQEASLATIETMTTAKTALTAAIANAREGNYDIWVSGSSFKTGPAFTVAMNGTSVSAGEGVECTMIVRNSQKTGAVIALANEYIKVGETRFPLNAERNKHDYQFAFDGTNVNIYIDGTLAGTEKQINVPIMTSVGTSAEWSVFGTKALTTYRPEIVSTVSSLSPSESFTNEYGKNELHALKLIGQTLRLDSPIDYHINGSTALTDTKIDITNEDSWIIFDNVRPSDVISKYLADISINGAKAVNSTNCRIAIYLHGAALIPHPSTYKPFYGYSGQLYSGEEYNFGTGNNTVGNAANELQSFILKRGYMVTLATNSDGSGYSRVYVADHEDKRIEKLPDLLNHRISYINVRKWNYVSKKGWCTTESTSATNTVGKLLGTTWFYTWSADRSTQTDMEYVPQKGHLYWPSWDQINGHSNATAVLGLNEPDHSEQHDSKSCSCGGTINSWTACTKTPDFFQCGLRIGSPSPTDANYLKEYIGHCNDMGYRVDFVGFHAYWGTNEAPNAESWKNQLQSIYNNTKRPIWLTEWNNGASWTTESWPSSYGDKLSKQREAIKKILEVLDNNDFIERYSIYNWDSYYRAVITWDSNKNNWWVTPAGEVYRDDHPSHAYKEKMQFIPIGWFPSMKTDNAFTFSLSEKSQTVISSITNKNGDFTEEEQIEYLTEAGTYAPFYTTTARSKFDTTTQRTAIIKRDECAAEAFDGTTLTLRMKITTLKGGVTYTDPVTKDIPLSMQNGYDDIKDITQNGTAITASGNCISISTPKATTVNIYSASGSLVKTVHCSGTTDIEMPNGIYIIEGRKIAVQ